MIDRLPLRLNALWFLLALVVGACGLLWLRSLNIHPWLPAVVAASVVFALMVVYLRVDGEYAPEEKGDNVYYLGLLFTLISLVFSLWEFFGLDAGMEWDRDNFQHLLQNFGTALTSTIAGIVCRVVLLNLQHMDGQVDRPRGVPISGEPNLTSLGIRDLTQTVNALARFHLIVRAHASDTTTYLGDLSRALKKESDEFKNHLIRNSELFCDTLRKDAEAFNRKLEEQSEITLSTVGDSLNSCAEQANHLVSQIKSAQEIQVAEIQKSNLAFLDDFQNTSAKSIEILTQNFESVMKQAIDLDKNTVKYHDQVNNELLKLESSLSHTQSALDSLTNHANNATKSTETLESEARKACTALSQICAVSEATSNALETIVKLDTQIRTAQQMDKTANSVHEIGLILQNICQEVSVAGRESSKVAGLFDKITQSIESMEQKTQHATKALDLLSREAESRLKKLRNSERSGFFGFFHRR